jgi:hypothetical protein
VANGPSTFIFNFWGEDKMDPEAVYKRIDDLTNEFQSQQIEIFRWLHQHPELAYQELQTGQFSSTI